VTKPAYGHQIERTLHARSVAVYALPQDVIRCDATTVSGQHEVTEGGLLQFGHSKDDPTRPQLKVMMGSLDPLGTALSTCASLLLHCCLIADKISTVVFCHF